MVRKEYSAGGVKHPFWFLNSKSRHPARSGRNVGETPHPQS